MPQTLLALLGQLNIASKEWVIRQYDHEVQGGSVIKPLVGVANDGPGDAAVVKPLLDETAGCPLYITREVFVISVGKVFQVLPPREFLGEMRESPEEVRKGFVLQHYRVLNQSQYKIPFLNKVHV